MTTTFSKKHYQKIAETLKAIRPIVHEPKDMPLGIEWHYTVDKFIEMFRADNPNFKPATFLKACGYETEESK